MDSDAMKHPSRLMRIESSQETAYQQDCVEQMPENPSPVGQGVETGFGPAPSQVQRWCSSICVRTQRCAWQLHRKVADGSRRAHLAGCEGPELLAASLTPPATQAKRRA